MSLSVLYSDMATHFVKNLASDVDDKAAVKLFQDVRSTDLVLYRALGSRDFALMAAMCSVIKLDSGELIARKGEAPTFFAVVLKGALVERDPTSEESVQYKRGDVFGACIVLCGSRLMLSIAQALFRSSIQLRARAM